MLPLCIIVIVNNTVDLNMILDKAATTKTAEIFVDFMLNFGSNFYLLSNKLDTHRRICVI